MVFSLICWWQIKVPAILGGAVGDSVSCLGFGRQAGELASLMGSITALYQGGCYQPQAPRMPVLITESFAPQHTVQSFIPSSCENFLILFGAGKTPVLVGRCRLPAEAGSRKWAFHCRAQWVQGWYGERGGLSPCCSASGQVCRNVLGQPGTGSTQTLGMGTPLKVPSPGFYIAGFYPSCGTRVIK